MMIREPEQMIDPAPAEFERPIVAMREQAPFTAPYFECGRDQGQLDAPVRPVGEHVPQGSPALWHRKSQCISNFRETAPPAVEIHCAPIGGIDHIKAPQFAAPINVRYPRRSLGEHDLTQSIEHAEPGNARLELEEIVEEWVG